MAYNSSNDIKNIRQKFWLFKGKLSDEIQVCVSVSVFLTFEMNKNVFLEDLPPD